MRHDDKFRKQAPWIRPRFHQRPGASTPNQRPAKSRCPKEANIPGQGERGQNDPARLDDCLGHLREGDTLIVWRLDLLGRSVRHLIDLVDQLRQRKIGFKSNCDGAIDTTTQPGPV